MIGRPKMNSSVLEEWRMAQFAVRGTLILMSSSHNKVEVDTRLELTSEVLDVGSVYNWAAIESCGAVVVFSGIVRDNAEGRTDVKSLTYEAYEDQVVPKLEIIADEMRSRWSDLGRIALIHRVGKLELTESSVLVVVSSPHRPEAFAAARYAIDALKISVPIWKQENWKDGSDWGTNSHEISDARKVKSSTL
jgi:molybdopterin synthase catalytic subunit